MCLITLFLDYLVIHNHYVNTLIICILGGLNLILIMVLYKLK